MTRRTVLITGAARRLGSVMARAFDAAGWHVVIHYRFSAEAADALAAGLRSAETVRCDLADADAVVDMAATLARRHEDWAALINSAAIFERDDHDACDPEVFDRSMRVNTLGPVLLMQAYLAHARARRGRRVINVLDMKLANINPDFFSYTMSKYALGAATEMTAMAREAGEDRIFGLGPGAMLPSHDQRGAEHELSGRMNLLERVTSPKELADAALFLAEGPLASGQTLFVDSGQHLLRQHRDVLFLARQQNA